MSTHVWRKRALLSIGAIALFAVLVLAGVRLGLITWSPVQERVTRLFTRNFGAVEAAPGVYRGGQPSAFGRDWLEAVYDPGTVIHLAWADTPEDLEEERYYKEHGADYFRVSWVPEGAPSREELEQMLALIDSAKKPVYVHCIGGKDRTGGIIGMLELRKGKMLHVIAEKWKRYGNPSHGWQEALRVFPRKLEAEPGS